MRLFCDGPACERWPRLKGRSAGKWRGGFESVSLAFVAADELAGSMRLLRPS
jgi:hypothetical protein